jgi:C8 domain
MNPNGTFVANYNYTTSNPVFQDNAAAVCSALTGESNTIAAQCGSYIDPNTFYTACLNDVIATQDLSLAESALLAYSTLCSQYLAPQNTCMLFPHRS